MSMDNELETLVVDFEKMIEYQLDEAAPRGDFELPRVAFKSGQVLRVFPPKKQPTISGSPVDMLVLATVPYVQVVPIHYHPLLATHFHALVNMTDHNAVATRIVACLDLGEELLPAQQDDCVHVGDVNESQTAGVLALFKSIFVGGWGITSESASAFGVELVLTRNEERVSVVRGLAAPSSDPRHRVAQAISRLCGWVYGAGEVLGGVLHHDTKAGERPPSPSTLYPWLPPPSWGAVRQPQQLAAADKPDPPYHDGKWCLLVQQRDDTLLFLAYGYVGGIVELNGEMVAESTAFKGPDDEEMFLYRVEEGVWHFSCSDEQ